MISMSSDKTDNIFDIQNIIAVVLKRKMLLLSICLIATIASCAVSLLITPRYKATHILFPASSSSISQSLVSEAPGKKDIFKFGEDEDVEQLMQVLHSNEIRNRIIEKYDLFNHYEISPNSKYPFTTLYRKYDKNVSIRRTQYMSIRIDVLDKCPETAANIANDISELADSTIKRMKKDRIERAYKIINREFVDQKQKIQNIEDSLKVLGAMGIIDVRSQSEVYSDQYAAALASGNIRGAMEIQKTLQVLEEFGSAHMILKEKMFEEVKKLAVIETKYIEARIDMEEDLPNKYVVDYADVPERKAYPIRWLIVTLSVISTFLFALTVLLFLERIGIKKKLKL